MTRMRQKLVKVTSAITLIVFGSSFTACTESPFQPDKEEAIGSTQSLAKGGPNRTKESTSDSTISSDTNLSGLTVEKGSFTSRYNKKWDAYQGGKIILSQGSQFELLYGSLKPPAELYGQDVTLTMAVVRDQAKCELRFEFGPPGSQFDPPATVWFHYEGSNPKLYYIEDDGSYTEQQPDEVDTKNGWLMLKINHFSRYAIGWGDY